MRDLKVTDVTVDASSYVDPGGRVLHHNGEVLRALSQGASSFYSDLLLDPTIAQLIGSHIVDTEMTDYTIEGFGSVLRHRKIEPLSYCVEWPAEMLREAALLNLDICQEILTAGYTLQDAYPWNVLFDGPRPVFIDFTSIIPLESDLLWRAYGQFTGFFLHPLLLYNAGSGEVVRNLLYDYIQGISIDTTSRLLPVSAYLRRPSLFGQIGIPRMLHTMLKKTGTESRLAERTRGMKIPPEARASFFRSLRAKIRDLSLAIPDTQWRNYYSDIKTFYDPTHFHAKQRNVASVLERVKPRTVVDIGSNEGGYSIMAALRGARVVAFDTDEACVSLLYRHAKEAQLDILPLIMSATNPTPAFGWRAQQFPSATDRLRGDLALALAVVHHLAFTQRQDFARIARTMSDFSHRWLLTEFVPAEDEMSRKILVTNRRDISWYTLDNFVAALQQEFREVQLMASHPEGRTLILCEK